MEIDSYRPGEFYDELFLPDGTPRSIATTLIDKISSLSLSELQQHQNLAQSTLFKTGVTFNVYSDDRGTEKILPFDIIPRNMTPDPLGRLDAHTRLEKSRRRVNHILGDYPIENNLLLAVDVT